MRIILCVVSLLLISNSVRAGFVTFGSVQFGGSKWDDRNFGTPAVVSWSFMAEGTPIAATAAGGTLAPLINGTSHINSLRTTYDTTYGSGSFDSAILGAINAWAATTPNLQFVQGTDPGAGFGVGATGAHTVDIRIGAFTPSSTTNNFGLSAAFGYGPPGTDDFFPDALAGDILLNTNQLFFRAPGAEGATFDPFRPFVMGDPLSGVFQNDLQGLVVHELGHAIGLGHPANGPDDVMYVGPRDARGWFVNRIPSPDDAAGAITIYGPTAVPEPATVVLFSLPLIGLVWLSSRIQIKKK